MTAFYRGSLQWVLFFLRLRCPCSSRALPCRAIWPPGPAPYGIVLGGLVWFALQQFVDYSENPTLAGRSGLINFGLIVLIWWSSHRLTRDCTYLDNESSTGGVGLLDEAGLDRAGQDKPTVQPKKAKKSKKPKPEELPGLPGWWERFRQYQAKKKEQPHTLGVWVVFLFAGRVAALRARPGADPRGGSGPAAVCVFAAGRLRRRRPWVAADHQLPGPAFLFATAQGDHAAGNHARLAFLGRSADRDASVREQSAAAARRSAAALGLDRAHRGRERDFVGLVAVRCQ